MAHRLTWRLAGRMVGGIFGLVAVASLVLLVLLPRAVDGAALTVLSGSMSPTYPVGSAVIVRPVDPADVEVGDAITFATAGGSFTTHRVLDVTFSNGEPVFTTQGDANRAPDKDPVPADAVRGRVWFHVPFLGSARDAISGPAGLVVVGLVVVLALAWDRVQAAWRRWRGRPVTTASGDARHSDGAPSPVSDPYPHHDGPGTPTHASMTGPPIDHPPAQHVLLLEVASPAGSSARREITGLCGDVDGRVIAVDARRLVVAFMGDVHHIDSVERLFASYDVTQAVRSIPVAFPPSASDAVSISPADSTDVARQPSAHPHRAGGMAPDGAQPWFSRAAHDAASRP